VEVDPGNWLAMVRPTSALAIVTTVDSQGRVNAAPHATVVRVSQQPLQLAFTCSEASDTRANIEATGQFTLNYVPDSHEVLKQVLTAAQSWPRGVNESARAGMTSLPGLKVGPPRLAECYVHVELETEWVKSWSGRCMVVGQVVAVTARRDCVDDNDELKWERARPVHFWGGPDHASFSPLGPPVPVLPG